MSTSSIAISAFAVNTPFSFAPALEPNGSGTNPFAGFVSTLQSARNPIESFTASLVQILQVAEQIEKLESATKRLIGGKQDSVGAPSLENNANGEKPLVIAQIDSFNDRADGFNHGETVGQFIESGGVDPGLAGKIDILKYNLSNTPNKTDGIADAMEDIIRRVRNGEKIDAVNLSQQDFTADGDTERVQRAIEELKDLNVPVAVAAGNAGTGTINQLASGSAFVVESTTHGVRNSSSSEGNISVEGSTTSYATGKLAPLLAKLKALGLTVDEIKQALG